MTHTDPTAAALLRAILLRPDDDTARLVYADWLDEHAGTNGYAPCPECKGEGRPARQYPLLCHKCGGTGLVPASDGFADRAEFIRVQCELARKRDSEPPPAPTRELAEFVRDLMRLEARERELLTDARRAEWFGIQCPVCKGSRRVLYGDAETGASLELGCTDCASTGLAPVEFRRGFPERVWCRMEDVLREKRCTTCRDDGTLIGDPECEWCDGSGRMASEEDSDRTEDCAHCDVMTCPHCDGTKRLGHELTPWAAGVLAAHPVTDWEIADLPANIAVLPQPAYRAACAIDPNPGTREREVEVIALAVGRVARRLAGLPETTP